MSWSVRTGSGDTRNKLKRELSEVVQTIAKYEPVRVLAPRGSLFREARREFGACANTDIIEAPIDDIWMRDIAPTFAVRDTGTSRDIVAINWNFNGWGGTAKIKKGDECAADVITAISGVPCFRATFLAEGGALIFGGNRTVITTRSCLLNPNRNPVVPGVDRQHLIETDLRRFGIDKVIWLEGDSSEPVTSGHVDGYVLVGTTGTILVEYTNDPKLEGPMWRDHDIEVLARAGYTPDRRYQIVKVAAPRFQYWKKKSQSFAPAYLNAYVANGAVISGRFGDSDRDRAVRIALEKAFPARKVILLDINHLAERGGGIRCLTQPMPLIE
jgi:agmatine deiminase